jgi:hypothetical protein
MCSLCSRQDEMFRSSSTPGSKCDRLVTSLVYMRLFQNKPQGSSTHYDLTDAIGNRRTAQIKSIAQDGKCNRHQKSTATADGLHVSRGE